MHIYYEKPDSVMEDKMSRHVAWEGGHEKCTYKFP